MLGTPVEKNLLYQEYTKAAGARPLSSNIFWRDLKKRLPSATKRMGAQGRDGTFATLPPLEKARAVRRVPQGLAGGSRRPADRRAHARARARARNRAPPGTQTDGGPAPAATPPRRVPHGVHHKGPEMGRAVPQGYRALQSGTRTRAPQRPCASCSDRRRPPIFWLPQLIARLPSN